MLKILYLFTFDEGKKGKLYNLINEIVSQITNFIMPLIYKVSRKGMGVTQENNKIIISITTYPARINKIWITIESLLRQTYKPNKIILWLARSQFEEQEKNLPKNLLKLRKRGLDINYCEDTKSYKKFINTAKTYNDYTIITVDDDVIYPNDLVEKLVDTYKRNNKCVCCYRAHEILLDDNLKPKKYNNWNLLSNGKKGPSNLLMATGVGGILYPPKFFNYEMLDIDLIEQLCPSADDIWLKFMELKNGYKVVKVNETCKKWFTLNSTQRNALYRKNRDKNINDKAINNLINYFKIDFRRYINE